MPFETKPHEADRPAIGHVDLSERIVTVSATMVGVCLTVIGIVRVSDDLRRMQSITDNVVAIDAVVFLASTLLAYSSIRARNPRHKRAFERIADVLFITALIGMAAVCGLVAYEVV